jgi:hypothetical protein
MLLDLLPSGRAVGTIVTEVVAGASLGRIAIVCCSITVVLVLRHPFHRFLGWVTGVRANETLITPWTLRQVVKVVAHHASNRGAGEDAGRYLC